MLLGVIADLHAWANDDGAGGRLILAADQPEQHRFARAIGTNQPHPLAAHDQQIHAVQHHVQVTIWQLECSPHAGDLQHLAAAYPPGEL